MTASIVDAESVLALDIGSIHTRALLFDVVDGQYRFIAAGLAPNTSTAPYFDVTEGVLQAIQKLQELTARKLLDGRTQLIIPSQADGSGVDQMSVTFSTGPGMRVVVLGLLEDVSLESATRLAAGIPGQIVESIGLNDRRRTEEQIDAILKAKPDLILLAGGTDGGATRSMARLVDLIQLTLQVLPREKRPEILYAGNHALVKNVQGALEPLATTRATPNIRPSIDQEVFNSAQAIVASEIGQIAVQRIGGLQSFGRLSSTTPVPAAYAFGRMIRLLGRVYDRQKGVMGVDLGGSYTTIAAAREDRLSLDVTPYGLNKGLAAALAETPIDEIAQWLPFQVQEEIVRDYLHNKTLFPRTVPETDESLAIEHAMARCVLQRAIQRFNRHWPGLTLSFEPIIASGSILTHGATPGQALMMLLDGIQPVGVTTLVLDAHGLLPALGALAEANPMLPVQVIESNAFINLGTVIAPRCKARYGTPVLKVRLEFEGAEDVHLEIEQGTLTPLPIRPGQAARIHLHPLCPMQITANHNDQTRSFRIVGGTNGAVIDTRGRPLSLPDDPTGRRELVRKWALNFM